jgi:hypothetical protein
VQLGLENRKKAIWAAALCVLALLGLGYEILPFFWGPSSTAGASTPVVPAAAPSSARPASRSAAKVSKKVAPPDSLDPTLQLQLLASSEQIKYNGSGRNIFVSQAETVNIERPKTNGTLDAQKAAAPPIYTAPPVPQPERIPLKFFGFANGPGEPKRIFLSKDQDVFIAGEGEIIDRRYRVVRITPTSVDIEDLVVSGPAQNIPLTQSPG